MAKPLSVSIIIPVYNEAHRLKHCLDAIAAQTVTPLEVIVADNNSTDKSVAIAQSYPFVTVIHVKKQGQSYARNAAFDCAKGDILGRIDADAVIATDWVARLQHIFKDENVDAVTGLGAAAVLPRISWPKTVLWSWMYFLWMKGVFRLPVLWGANMALRRTMWQKVKDVVVTDDKTIHEDQDLGLCVLEAAGGVRIDNHLRMTTGGQTYHYFPKLVTYTRMIYQTKRLHASRPAFKNLRRSLPLPFVALLWVCPGLILLPFFFGMSLVLWPFDALVSRMGFSQTWLD